VPFDANRLARSPRGEARNEETLRRYGSGTPDDWLERHVYARYPNLCVGLLAVIDVRPFGLPGVSAWAMQMMWIPFQCQPANTRVRG